MVDSKKIVKNENVADVTVGVKKVGGFFDNVKSIIYFVFMVFGAVWFIFVVYTELKADTKTNGKQDIEIQLLNEKIDSRATVHSLQDMEDKLQKHVQDAQVENLKQDEKIETLMDDKKYKEGYDQALKDYRIKKTQ